MEIDKQTRDEAKKKIKTLLSKKLDKKSIYDIEDGIFEFSKSYANDNNTPYLLESIYADKLNQLLCILNSDKLNNILQSLKNKDFEAKTLAFLKPEELNPEKFEKIIKKKEIEEHKKNNKATTNAFKCSKCGKRKCTVEEKQIRSGDEPATTFVECQECGHKFSF